jgi:hypothetical protein
MTNIYTGQTLSALGDKDFCRKAGLTHPQDRFHIHPANRGERHHFKGWANAKWAATEFILEDIDGKSVRMSVREMIGVHGFTANKLNKLLAGEMVDRTFIKGNKPKVIVRPFVRIFALKDKDGLRFEGTKPQLCKTLSARVSDLYPLLRGDVTKQRGFKVESYRDEEVHFKTGLSNLMPNNHR